MGGHPLSPCLSGHGSRGRLERSGGTNTGPGLSCRARVLRLGSFSHGPATAPSSRPLPQGLLGALPAGVARPQRAELGSRGRRAEGPPCWHGLGSRSSRVSGNGRTATEGTGRARVAALSSKGCGTPPLLLGSRKLHSPNLQGTGPWKDTGQRRKEAAPASAESRQWGPGPRSPAGLLPRAEGLGGATRRQACVEPRLLPSGPWPPPSIPGQERTPGPLRGPPLALLPAPSSPGPARGAPPASNTPRERRAGACGARNGRRSHGSPQARGGRPPPRAPVPAGRTPARLPRPGRRQPRAEDGGTTRPRGGAAPAPRRSRPNRDTRERKVSHSIYACGFPAMPPHRCTEIPPSGAAPGDPSLPPGPVPCPLRAE